VSKSKAEAAAKLSVSFMTPPDLCALVARGAAVVKLE
jgi:hypothetical protein